MQRIYMGRKRKFLGPHIWKRWKKTLGVKRVACLGSHAACHLPIYSPIFPSVSHKSRRPTILLLLFFVSSMAAATKANMDLEVFGKAASGTGSPSPHRGDCPFSQRIYLELEEKGLPYKATYIEEGPNKPQWFMEKNPSGLLPVLRDGHNWIQDSDKIAEYLEEKFPDTSLKTPPHLKQIGSGLFPSFTNWLQSKKANDPAKEEYIKELKALNDHLQSRGPYIAGDRPTDADFALAPKLRHARVALAHYMDFHIPPEFTAVHKYIELMEKRPSFRKTDSPDTMIIEGWKKKFNLPEKIAQPQAS